MSNKFKNENVEKIKVDHFTKDYGQGCGVFNINLCISKGEMMGFVNSNGAGKTILISSHLYEELESDCD